jgi:hypothetical protein
MAGTSTNWENALESWLKCHSWIIWVRRRGEQRCPLPLATARVFAPLVDSCAAVQLAFSLQVPDSSASEEDFSCGQPDLRVQ